MKNRGVKLADEVAFGHIAKKLFKMSKISRLT